MSRILSYREALGEGIRQEMEADERVFMLGEDIAVYGGAYKVSRGLLELFGERRIIDAPMSEALIVGAGVGAALIGLRPIVEVMYIDFSTLASDQIINQAAKFHFMTGGNVNVPLVIRTQQGTGRSAAAQHSQSLESWYAHIPGLKVLMPATPYDAKGLIKAAVKDENPVMVIEHKGLYTLKGEVPEEDYTVEIGKADIKREGTDLTILTYSKMLHYCLKAAEDVEERQGLSVEVLDLRSLRPLDDAAIKTSLEKTRNVLIVTESNKTAGMSAELFAKSYELVPDLKHVVRLAGKDTIMACSPKLEEFSVPSIDEIKEALTAMAA
ncbi:alpha-ketoacid dehydrogenase subunit beta [candidate division KSB3 bacterium]|uniref:Alpha-ketoacid dehydrogenase subunit beta n=1 Tax=candidate division KSB3 bacterium TaxID=2044937 RepID=A0A2G6E2V1_9BACT|nr:MAG: alpha-ketoacid dehydrogenase subunit beta [candidate division KSB3 bacterium]PIE28900.1 MAG: alpha-ketoacid dehydrogenase subunit beta [candidate division KSB3 bacterium]